MKTTIGHLTYCSNIHAGEEWQEHFAILQKSVPAIKANVSPHTPMGLGLRLANKASIDLSEPTALADFQAWLQANHLYVFTMNGFPYGGFHDTVVKDQVHAPDWTTQARVDYTIRMFELLAKLLPEDLQEGGISTSPLSYRHWWKSPEELQTATHTATLNMLKVAAKLNQLFEETGKCLHLDIEPEPDGILDNGQDFLAWYSQTLLPLSVAYFGTKGIDATTAHRIVYRHIQLCYDVCHFAVSYEEPADFLAALHAQGINVGKIQISAALQLDFDQQTAEKLAMLKQYDEPTYLHQVVAKKADGSLQKFADLGFALATTEQESYQQWRIHYHVPLFTETYGLLASTRKEIEKTIALQKAQPFTQHLELETYTWGVLPAAVQIPLDDSISREIAWVQSLI